MVIDYTDRKKTMILDLLKEHHNCSTSYIAHRIQSNKYRTVDLLEDLLKDRKIKKIKKGVETHWELK